MAHCVTLDPPFPLVFPLDDLHFPSLYTYMRDIEQGNHLDESTLQFAINTITAYAAGKVSRHLAKTVGAINVRQTSNLDRFLVGSVDEPTPFDEQRIPRLLIDWRNEVLAIKGSRSAGASASTPLQTISEEQAPLSSKSRPSPIKRVRTSRSTSSKREKSSPSSCSSKSGVRIPDVIVVFQPADKVVYRSLILMIIKLKVLNPTSGVSASSEDNRPVQWKRGMSQGILYLAQAHDDCGTYLGTVIVGTQFARLFARSNVIAVEISKRCKDALEAGRSMTIQAFIERAKELSGAMPHDIFPRNSDSDTALDSEGVAIHAMTTLWNHIARCRSIVQTFPIDKLPSRVPPPDNHADFEHVSFDDDITSDLPGLLSLASTAHPDTFPAWWTKAKLALIQAGRPYELVSRDAYRPRKRSTNTRDNGGDDRDSNNEGGDGDGDGGGRTDGGPKGDDAGGADNGGHSSYDGENHGGRGGTSDFEKGQSGDRAPNTGGGSGVHSAVLSATPPDSEDEEAGANLHRERWLEQQHELAQPATPDPSPRRQRLYTAAEISRSSIITGDMLGSSMAEESDRDEEELKRMAADFTLRGWRVVLVATPEFDAL